MMRVILILSFLCTLVNLNAQDYIIVTNGNILKAKVIEVGDKEIKYKKFQDLDGPLRTISVDLVKKIKYENGEVYYVKSMIVTTTSLLSIDQKMFGAKYYAGNEIITKKEFLKKLESNPIAYKNFKNGQNLEVAADLIGFSSGFILGYTIGRYAVRKRDLNKPLVIGSGIVCVASLVMNSVGGMKVWKSMERYNSGDLGLNFEIINSGVGLTIQF